MSEVSEEYSPEQPVPFVPPTPEALEALLPHYEIKQLIASGGMGAVYSGVQRDLERPAAIKILPPDAARDKESIDRFRTEAKAMARLTHPHIPAVFDFGVVDEFCVLVMELVEGPNVYTLIRQGEVTPPRALEIMAQVCDAVQFAHSRNIVHGDIKPGNILMNQDGQVKLADFGLARLMGGQGDKDSDSWTPMGTPEYAAPELYDKNAQPDHRADIYSLGVVLHEMLTGAPPAGEFELPGEGLGLDPRVDEIIARCMELKPEQRYQTAQEVRVVLREIIEGRNVPVRAPAAKREPKKILRPGRRTPAGVKIPGAKKKPAVSPPAPGTTAAVPVKKAVTQRKMAPGPRTGVRPTVKAVSSPRSRRRVVVVGGSGGFSDDAKRGILIGAALLVIGLAVWLILSGGEQKGKPDKEAKQEPETPATPAVVPPLVTPRSTTPPPRDTVKAPNTNPDAPPMKNPEGATPTAATARLHELRVTSRNDWNAKVEPRLKEPLSRLTVQYLQALQKLEDESQGKGDAAAVVAIRQEYDRFQKSPEPVKADAISSVAAVAKSQQALSGQLEKMWAGLKYDTDKVKDGYMLALHELEKQMDAAQDKTGSQMVADEFQKVAALKDADLRNYFTGTDSK